MATLECVLFSVSTPSYFQGSSMPYLQILVQKAMPLGTIKTELVRAFNNDELANAPDSVDDEAYLSAIDEVYLVEGYTTAFNDIDDPSDNDAEALYAYFMFREV